MNIFPLLAWRLIYSWVWKTTSFLPEEKLIAHVHNSCWCGSKPEGSKQVVQYDLTETSSPPLESQQSPPPSAPAPHTHTHTHIVPDCNASQSSTLRSLLPRTPNKSGIGMPQTYAGITKEDMEDALAWCKQEDALAWCKQEDALASCKQEDALASCKQEDALDSCKQEDTLASCKQEHYFKSGEKDRRWDMKSGN